MTDFVRVPSDGAGKRIGAVARLTLSYQNRTGEFEIEKTLTGATSGATGTLTGFNPTGAGGGFVTLKDPVGTFQDGENLQVEGQTVAQADLTTGENLVKYAQEVVLIDPNNRGNIGTIDRFGALTTRFTDGTPVFGPFGTMATGEPQIIRSYSNPYGLDTEDWEYTTATGGTITFDSVRRTTVSAVTTATGSSATKTTHFYHPYASGVGTRAVQVIQMGDQGKTNVVRRWGLFDENNGVFWELDGTQLAVVVRSSASGSVVENRILQSDWNEDRLDGTDGIAFNLDVAAPNMYAIDFQWYGAGVVAFSVYEPGGQKLVAHRVQHANDSSLIFPYMQTATLPLRAEIFNSGTALSASEMRSSSGIVTHEHRVPVAGRPHSINSGLVSVGSTEIPILALRTKASINGIDWRGLAKVLSASYTHGGPSGTSAPIAVRARFATSDVLTGAVWTDVGSNSGLDYDVSATAINTATTRTVYSSVLSPLSSNVSRDLSDRDEYRYVLHNNRDLTPRYVIFTAQHLNGANADFSIAANWEEIES